MTRMEELVGSNMVGRIHFFLVMVCSILCHNDLTAADDLLTRRYKLTLMYSIRFLNRLPQLCLEEIGPANDLFKC